MAWNKDVKILVKTHAEWTDQNPVIPSGALIGIKDGNDVSLMLGEGSNYIDTYKILQAQLATKITKGTSSTKVVLEDGTSTELVTLTIQDFIDAGYHLVTSTEWDSLKLVSFPAPSFVATPSFSTLVREIGTTLSGSFGFNLAKTNNAYFKATTGGNITANQGNWTGLGDFDLVGVSSKTLTANSFTLSSAGTITLTLYGRDIYDQQVSLQTISFEFQYPIWMGTKSNTSIIDENSLSNKVKKVGSTYKDMEFYIDPDGVLSYFHLLIPTEICDDLDIRDLSSPTPGSGNMVLQGTVNLTLGSITKSYNHYVSDFQSAAEVDFILKETV